MVRLLDSWCGLGHSMTRRASHQAHEQAKREVGKDPVPDPPSDAAELGGRPKGLMVASGQGSVFGECSHGRPPRGTVWPAGLFIGLTGAFLEGMPRWGSNIRWAHAGAAPRARWAGKDDCPRFCGRPRPPYTLANLEITAWCCGKRVRSASRFGISKSAKSNPGVTVHPHKA